MANDKIGGQQTLYMAESLTTRVTGCAAVCAIRVDPLVMRFFKEMT